MKTTAVHRGGEYVLNGSNLFITNAGHAAWTVVFAERDSTRGTRASRRSSCRWTRLG